MNNGHPQLPSVAPERVLLINPPVYDTRLHWDKWQQPTQLLKLGTYFKRQKTDVKLIDALHTKKDEVLRRKRVDMLEIEEFKIPKWRIGTPKSSIVKQLTEFKKNGWIPDVAYVESFATFWWEGAEEVIATVKHIFPQCPVQLFGAYPSLAPDHARENTLADEIVTEAWPEVTCLPADLSLYPTPPSFAYLTLGRGARSVEEVIEEIEAALRLGTKEFVFAEESIANLYINLYCSVLDKIATGDLKVRLYALGNISPADVAANPPLIRLMKDAGYNQIWLADDRHSPIASSVDEQLIENYQITAKLCHAAGFRERSDAVIASVCLGRLNEDLTERAQLATLAAHHVGSVILWAYQPEPNDFPEIPLEEQNGKLFPLRKRNGYTYREYLDVLGLAVVLNAKYRTITFDFMGEGLVPRLFRESLARRAWEPDPEVKGGLKLPMLHRPVEIK